MTEARPLPHRACPLCGGDNACAPARTGTFDTPCWCRAARVDPAALGRVPAERRGTACLCPRCAAAAPPTGAPADA